MSETRCRSTAPDFQNTPVRTELGKKLRRVFQPEAGRVFIACDYAGLELRVAAMCMSQPQPQGRGCPVCFKRGAECKCGLMVSQKEKTK
jgi:hypothetical protein